MIFNKTANWLFIRQSGWSVSQYYHWNYGVFCSFEIVDTELQCKEIALGVKKKNNSACKTERKSKMFVEEISGTFNWKSKNRN